MLKLVLPYVLISELTVGLLQIMKSTWSSIDPEASQIVIYRFVSYHIIADSLVPSNIVTILLNCYHINDLMM